MAEAMHKKTVRLSFKKTEWRKQLNKTHNLWLSMSTKTIYFTHRKHTNLHRMNTGALSIHLECFKSKSHMFSVPRVIPEVANKLNLFYLGSIFISRKKTTWWWKCRWTLMKHNIFQWFIWNVNTKIINWTIQSVGCTEWWSAFIFLLAFSFTHYT